jgi:SHS family sialic acid transporter-like MFS transporter
LQAERATYASKGSWRRDISAKQWLTLAGVWAVWALDAIDYLAITFVLSDIAKEFNVSLGTTSLLLLATYGVRWAGGLLFGSLSDRIGRKVPLLICLGWFTLGATFTGLAWSFPALVVIRILLGFGMAPAFTLGATMIAESWPERHRALGIGILDTGWGVGAIGAAALYGFVYPHFGWRAMFFVGFLPSLLLALFIALKVPEPPTFQRKEARAKGLNPIVQLFGAYPGRVAFLAVLMIVLFFGSWPFQGLFPTYLKGLGMPALTVSRITTISAVGQIVGFLASGVIAERLGRRYGLAAMIAVGVACVLAMLAFVSRSPFVEIFAFLAAFFLVGSSGIWGTILTESLPMSVRASGVGFLYNIGAVGGGCAPFVVLASLKALHIDLRAGIGLFTVLAAIVGIVLVLFVRETRGVSLAEDLEESSGGG